jgi:Homologous recombination OB-fold protein
VDFRVTLRDPTGEIDGAIQRKAIEMHPSIACGAVVVLEEVKKHACCVV